MHDTKPLRPEEASSRPPVRTAGLSDAIDADFARYDIPHSPGVMIAVLRGDDVLHLAGYGCANAEFDIPWTAGISYTFFSLSKSMVAAAFHLLQDAGRLSIDDPIAGYLPDYAHFDPPVTIRHLLTHTSGIWQDEALLQLIGTSMGEHALSLQDCRAMTLRQRRLAYRPGSHYHYNDTGLRIAADVLEQVTGLPFEAAMRQTLFAPAAMAGAFVQTPEPSRRPLQASSYFVPDGPLADSRGALIPCQTLESSGDGAVCGTMADLIAYARFLRAGPEGQRMIDRLCAPVEYRPGVSGHYRTCFGVSQHRGVEFWSHSGLFGKLIIYLPAIDSWILIMRNALDQAKGMDADDGCGIMDHVLRHDPRTRDHMRTHPLAQVRYPDWPSQDFTEAEMTALSGTFFEPESGFVLRIKRDGIRLRTSLLGEADELVRIRGRNDDQGFTSCYGPQFDLLNLDGNDFALMHADWPSPRPLRRIADVHEPSREVLAEVVGTYISVDYGAACHIIADEGRLVLQIGSGLQMVDRLSIQPVDRDVFEAAATAATFAQQYSSILIRMDRKDGQLVGLTLSTDNVRGLAYRRVLAL